MASWNAYFAGRRVWVTGASSGIGEAMVRLLGQADVETIASARRLDRLEALAADYPSVSPMPLDLAARDTLDEAATRAWDHLGRVDILINNAGISQRSLFTQSDPAVLERVLEVDLMGTMRLTRAVAARMQNQGWGHLVAVTSIVARIPTPQRTAYAAAKAGVHGLYDALRGELEPHRINLTIAVPGFVKTEISTHAVTATGGEHGELDRNQATGHTAESCASQILTAVARRRREALVAMTPRLWLGLALRTLAPGLLWRMLARAEVT